MRFFFLSTLILTLVGSALLDPGQVNGEWQYVQERFTKQAAGNVFVSATPAPCERSATKTSFRSIIRSKVERLLNFMIAAQRSNEKGAQRDDSNKKDRSGKDNNPPIWRSESLELLGIGLGIGDVTGNGKNDVVVIDPSTVHLYEYENGQLTPLTEYTNRPLELKAVDVATVKKGGPCRIYVTAQNRGTIASFVLEYRAGELIPVIENVQYYLRIIIYPTKGPILLGQQRGVSTVYEGFIHRLEDKGTHISVLGRFGVPQKIPIFGFAIGDFEGKRRPLIAVYDRDDYLRIYNPQGQRVYKSIKRYGGSDVILRLEGIEDRSRTGTEIADSMKEEREYCRARIMCLDLDSDGRYEILATKHASATRRMLDRMKMLQEGEIVSLKWNGDALVTQWHTPKVQGMITDFAVSKLSGLKGTRLITLEREKTDWLSFLRSRSRIRAYDLDRLMREGVRAEK